MTDLSDQPIRDQARRIAAAPWCYAAGDVSRVIEALLGEAVNRAPPRIPLPHRRPSLTLARSWQGMEISVTLGLDPVTAEIREIFADTPQGGDIQSTLADACVLISIALQHGIPAAALAKSLARVPDLLAGEDATRPASPIGVLLEAILSEALPPPPDVAGLPVAPDPAPQLNGGEYVS
jgi:hypothetical protein